MAKSKQVDEPTKPEPRDWQAELAQAQHTLKRLPEMRDQARTHEEADEFNRLCVVLPNLIFAAAGAAATVRELEAVAEADRLEGEAKRLRADADRVSMAAAKLTDEVDRQVETERARILSNKASELLRRRDSLLARVPHRQPKKRRTLDDATEQLEQLRKHHARQTAVGYDRRGDSEYVEHVDQRLRDAEALVLRLRAELDEPRQAPNPERPETWSAAASSVAGTARRAARARINALFGGAVLVKAGEDREAV